MSGTGKGKHGRRGGCFVTVKGSSRRKGVMYCEPKEKWKKPG